MENKGVSDAVKQPKGRIRNLFVSAISPLGIKTFDDYLIGKKVVEIKGADVGVHALMEEVARLLEGDITLIHNPLCPERYDAVVAGDFVITGNAAAFRKRKLRLHSKTLPLRVRRIWKRKNILSVQWISELPINSLSTYSALFSARERKASKGKHGKRGKRECVAKTGNVKTKHKIRLFVAQIVNGC